jgi:hypothetical protein
MKVIELQMESGKIYHIPLEVVAKNRAAYYEKKDKDTTFKEEMDFVMNDDYEGIDWYQNNMNPDEVAAEAILAKDTSPIHFEEESVEEITK